MPTVWGPDWGPDWDPTGPPSTPALMDYCAIAPTMRKCCYNVGSNFGEYLTVLKLSGSWPTSWVVRCSLERLVYLGNLEVFCYLSWNYRAVQKSALPPQEKWIFHIWTIYSNGETQGSTLRRLGLPPHVCGGWKHKKMELGNIDRTIELGYIDENTELGNIAKKIELGRQEKCQTGKKSYNMYWKYLSWLVLPIRLISSGTAVVKRDIMSIS